MKRKRKQGGFSKPENVCQCEACQNCVPIGEGDFICDRDGAQEPAPMVISDYMPTDCYMQCNGKAWRRL